MGIKSIPRQTTCYHPQNSQEKKESQFSLCRLSLFLPFWWASAYSWTWPTASGLQGAGLDRDEEEGSPDSEDLIPTWLISMVCVSCLRISNPFIWLSSLTTKYQIKFDFQYITTYIVNHSTKILLLDLARLKTFPIKYNIDIAQWACWPVMLGWRANASYILFWIIVPNSVISLGVVWKCEFIRKWQATSIYLQNNLQSLTPEYF